MIKKSVRREILEKLVTLSAAAFGLVAALAWNDAVQELFKIIFPEDGSVVAKFLYAGFVTVVVVVITIYLGKLTQEVESE